MASKVVVMGRNYTSRLGMIRAAGMAGREVIVINTESRPRKRDRIDESSRYIAGYYTAPEPDSDALIAVLKENCIGDEKTIILPTDDYTAAVIDRRQDELAADFLFPNIRREAGAAVRCMDKDFQKTLALEAGLSAAKSRKAVFGGKGFSLPEGVSFPCFVKPEVSFQGSKFHMRKCASAEELADHLKAVAADLVKKGKKTDLLIEEFIQIEKEYDIPGFTDGENVVIPIFIEKGLIHRGVTGTGTLRPAAEFGDVPEKLKAMIRKLGFTGLIDIEMLESGGTLYFNELNMRFGASGFAATGAGINLPGMLIETLEGRKPETPEVDFGGKRFASEKVCFQEYQCGQINRKKFDEILDTADYTFIRNEADGGPYRAFRKAVRVYEIKKAAAGLLRRK